MGRSKFRVGAAASLVAAFTVLHGAAALAGPPLITNDPDTPGDGRWEINVAATGGRSGGQWEIAAPDVDANYGWGDDVQLSVHAPWNLRSATGQGWLAAPGPVELAIRWRFLRDESRQLSMAVQPHWVTAGTSSAIRKDLAPDYQEFVFPLQVAKELGESTVGLEVAAHFSAGAPEALQWGVFWMRACGGSWTCMAEVNTTRTAREPSAGIFNFGLRRVLSQHVALMGSIGTQAFGGEPRSVPVFYLGIQLLAGGPP